MKFITNAKPGKYIQEYVKCYNNAKFEGSILGNSLRDANI